MRKRIYLLILLSVGIASMARSQQQADTGKRYIKVPSGYLMVLRQGDDVFSALEKLALAEQIPSAQLSGLGFLHTRFGFFDAKKKVFKEKELKDLEMGSFTGSIAWQDGKPSLHIHGIGADSKFRAYGGHLLGATVSTGSLEILVTVFQGRLQRKKEESIGANVLQLEHR